MGINFQSELNPEQYEAVISQRPTNLILAGAGTGKTRTLTYRVAWLLERGISPENILLLTFTNKAAKEMLQRVEALTGYASSQFYGGTFHHICQRLLRRHLPNPNFVILDEDDALSLFTEVVKGESEGFQKDKANPSVRVLYEVISLSKNCLLPLEATIASKYPYLEEFSGLIQQFSRRYQEEKAEQNVMDYDDLLGHFVSLLESDPEIAEQYNQKFRHVLVDEYQDTNPIQMKMIHLIAKDHQIFAVGDDAQCIYTWRGADVKNIIDFPSNHPDTGVIKIQTNYRSTPEILDFANEIPVAERYEYTKILKSTHSHYRKPQVVSVLDARQQANFVIKRLIGLRNEGYRLSDVAVLYRAHYQSMELQMELTRQGIPFTITSGIRFFEQAHIKDILAYLRFVANSKDSRAFIRLLTRFPKIGDKIAERILYSLYQLQEEKKQPLFSLLEDEVIVKKVPSAALEYWWPFARILKKIYGGSKVFRGEDSSPHVELDLFSYVNELKNAEHIEEYEGINELIISILEEEYRAYLQRNFSNWESREEDIRSFATFCNKYDDLSELIQQVTLIQSEVTGDEDSLEERVRLSSVHQSKGLEFGAVFILNLNENAFPLKRAIEQDDVGEERRLFYVAVTRAKKELYLCCPNQMVADPKKLYFAMPLQRSRFLREIDSTLCDTLNISEKQKTGFSRRY